MIAVDTLIRMIERRRRNMLWLSRIVNREPHPSDVPMFMLWKTPEYVIYRIEKELSALASIGATQSGAVAILAAVFSVESEIKDELSFITTFLRRHFPEFMQSHGSIVTELRAIAKKSLDKEARTNYPPKEWLTNEINQEVFRLQFRDQLSHLTIFPRSEFDAQLLHLVLMNHMGGILFEFSSPAETWRHMMGRAGIALIRENRPIAYVETALN